MLSGKGYGINLVKGVFLVYLILVLHLLFIAFVGILILFFRGIFSHMALVLAVLAISFLLFICYFYYRVRFRRDLGNSSFFGNSLEVNFFRGLASFRIEGSLPKSNHGMDIKRGISQIKLCKSSRMHEMIELAGLLEKDLITIDEYNEVKRNILQF